MLKKSLFVLVGCVVLLTGCAKEYKDSNVQAQVVEKDYDPSKTITKTVTQNGKQVKKTETKPAEYEVTLSYNGITEEFESESLYNSVEEGQYVNAIYTQGLDENGKVVSESISLP